MNPPRLASRLDPDMMGRRSGESRDALDTRLHGGGSGGGSVRRWGTVTLGTLANQWREAKRAELIAERARLDAQIAALGVANPDTLAVEANGRADPPLRPALSVAPTPDRPIASGTRPDGGSAGSTGNGPGAEIATENGASATKLGETIPSGTSSGRRPFGGLDLGIGLSFTIDTGDLDRISEASVVDGIVRVDDKDNGRARIMLESHYFFTPCWKLFLQNPCRFDDNGLHRAVEKQERWGFGPFVAIQPGSGEIIDAIGAGIMVGARRAGIPGSFNIGLGIVIDPNTRVLGEGVRENQPLPGTETEVRFRETLQKGVLLLTSFSF